MQNDPIQQMLGTLYSAPLQPALWNTFLGQLSSISGVHKAALISHDIPRGEHRMLAVLGPEVLESVKAYEEHYYQFDEWTKRFPARGVHGKVMRGEEIWLDAELLKSTFYNDFLRPFGTRGIAAVGFGRAPGFDGLSIYRGPTEEPFSRELIATMQMVVPHLETALKLRRKLEGLEARISDLETALDAIASGVILLDRTGRCIFINSAAQKILDQRDGLFLERSELTAQGITESTRLRELLSSSLSQQICVTGGTHAMLISRFARRPLSLVAAPLPAQSLAYPSRAVAIVFIGDPDRKSALPTEVLALLYGLTPAEARLALALLNGSSLAEAADLYAIREQTARTQLKQIFQKTGTSRQGELIRLLSGIADPSSHAK